MAIGDLVQRAVHAATGVPRLSAAALRAGAGPGGAVEALRISEGALRAAATHGAGVPGRVNALRHFLWQALLTARLGEDVARAVAAAQESGTPTLRDSAVDERNNVVGREYGAAHAALLRRGSVGEALDALVPVALEKWEAEELVWVRPRS